MPNAKCEAPGENARKRSWKRWAASAAVIRRRQGYVGQGGDKCEARPEQALARRRVRGEGRR